jgi:acyl carrier protein phosphodiesterase
MNYLGHLYFSNNDKTLMLNNLFGDFVKGRDLSHFPIEIQKGLILHRQIDDFIDHFPLVNELQHELYEELPKISSIAIDLFFDHLLAKNWKDYHSKEINQFLKEFYESIHLENEFYTDSFKLMISKMLEMNWIAHYSSIDGLNKMCQGVSKRISFDNNLKFGKEVFLKHEKAINQVFRIYMEAAISKFNVDISK